MSDTFTVALDDHKYWANREYERTGGYKLCRNCKWIEIYELRIKNGALDEMRFICGLFDGMLGPYREHCTYFEARSED